MLFVADLDRSLRCYTDVFGMEIVTTEPRYSAAFLRLPRSGNHHDLGLFGLGAGAPPTPRRGIGLYHLAWQFDTIDELAEARPVLLDASAYTGESSHGAAKSMYGVDPDGNEFDLLWICLARTGGVQENTASVEHLDLDAELSRWSGTRSAGRIVIDCAEHHSPTV